MSFLEVRGISKQQHGNAIVKEANLSLRQYQKIAIAGETGSGKSTLLKIIAGLIQPDAGEIVLEDQRVEGPLEKLLPGHPDIAYLSQHFELRNNYTILEELDYLNKRSKEEAYALYKVCRIDHLLHRRTNEVSGGEKQRISLARLLLSSPKLLLLDEPYSNLDNIHKQVLKNVVHDIGEQLQITCMLVSHDPDDVLSWADEIMVLKDGMMVQQGAPSEIYNQPANEYVASLFGTYNLLSQQLYYSFTGVMVKGAAEKKIFIRPEQILVNAAHSKSIPATIRRIIYFGNALEADVLLPGNESIRVRTHLRKLTVGETVSLSLWYEKTWLL